MTLFISPQLCLFLPLKLQAFASVCGSCVGRRRKKKGHRSSLQIAYKRLLLALLRERDNHPKTLWMRPCELHATSLNRADQLADSFKFGVVHTSLNSGNRGQWYAWLIGKHLLRPIERRAAWADGGSKYVCVWQIDHKSILLYGFYVLIDCKLTVRDIKYIQMVGLKQFHG